MSDIDTAQVDSLKALDPNRPIREADKLVHRGDCPLSAIRIISHRIKATGIFASQTIHPMALDAGSGRRPQRQFRPNLTAPKTSNDRCCLKSDILRVGLDTQKQAE